MAVRIAESVLSAWRDELDEVPGEPGVQMLLSPAGDHQQAARAVRESFVELHDAYSDELDRSESEPWWPGEWDTLRVPGGVVVRVEDFDADESALFAFAAGLERRGVEGSLDVYHPPAVPTPPNAAHLLECRVRVRGERLRAEPRIYHWRADLRAHEAILAAAERWCRQRMPQAACKLTAGRIGVPVEAGEDVLDRMRDAVIDSEPTVVSTVSDDEFRSVAARSSSGGVSLIVGGARVEDGGWRSALSELTDLLHEHADLLAYAYVRRGWAYRAAVLHRELSADWPRRPNDQPRGPGGTPEAFEDVYAPDAFGVQLLGPGYAGRAPKSAAWRQQPAGSAAVLLEHVDLAAWFDAPFVPFWTAEQAPPPTILARARMELAPILYSPGVLSRNGYAAENEL